MDMEVSGKISEKDEEDRYDPKVHKIAYWIPDTEPGIYFFDVFEIVNLKTGECYQV